MDGCHVYDGEVVVTVETLCNTTRLECYTRKDESYTLTAAEKTGVETQKENEDEILKIPGATCLYRNHYKDSGSATFLTHRYIYIF